MKVLFETKTHMAARFLENLLKRRRVKVKVERPRQAGMRFRLLVTEKDFQGGLEHVARYAQKQGKAVPKEISEALEKVSDLELSQPAQKIDLTLPQEVVEAFRVEPEVQEDAQNESHGAIELAPELFADRTVSEEDYSDDFEEFVLVDDDVVNDLIFESRVLLDEDRNKIEVILIDDDKEVRQQIVSKFRELHYTNRIHEASNGLEGLDLVAKQEFDDVIKPYIVLLDYDMPLANGVQFLKLVQDHFPYHRSAVFMMYDGTQKHVRIEAQKYGVKDFMDKDKGLKDLEPMFNMIESFCRNSSVKSGK